VKRTVQRWQLLAPLCASLARTSVDFARYLLNDIVIISATAAYRLGRINEIRVDSGSGRLWTPIHRKLESGFHLEIKI